MAIVTITRNAKCADCKFLEAYYEGKRKYHKCVNGKSKNHLNQIRMNDLVCDNWEYKYM